MEKPNAPEILPASHLLAMRLSSGAVHRVPDTEVLADAEAAIKALAYSYHEILAAAAGEMARLVAAGGPDGKTLDLDALYRHAHDVKGHAASVGYPMATHVAQSLCHFIDSRRKAWSDRRTVVILQSHAQALMGIARNRCSGDGGDIGRKIIAALERLVAALPSRQAGGTPHAVDDELHR